MNIFNGREISEGYRVGQHLVVRESRVCLPVRDEHVPASRDIRRGFYEASFGHHGPGENRGVVRYRVPMYVEPVLEAAAHRRRFYRGVPCQCVNISVHSQHMRKVADAGNYAV